MIRGKSNLDDIKSYLDHEMQQRPSERSAELTGVYNEVYRLQEVAQDRSRELDIRRLTDTPLFDVPAKPWTTVTADDQFVSHLVSLWFTWSAQVLNCVEKDEFITAMKSGNLDSESCSPLLVNAMLADASVGIPSLILYTRSDA